MTDWAQAGGNPQRTSYQPAETLPGSTWTRSWVAQHQIEFSPVEKLHTAVQPIISAGHVLIGSIVTGSAPSGKLRSYAASATKTLQWVVDVGAPVFSTPAADGTNVYVADLYGRISAYQLSNGSPAAGWTNPVQVTDGRPFQASLLLADGKLMIGGADGTFYARSLSNGGPIWSYPVGSPILQTAAWSNATGVGLAVFGAMNGRVYALTTAAGTLGWQTAALTNAGLFKDGWPVIVEGGQNKVLIRPMVQYPHWVSGVPSALQSPTRGIIATNFLDATTQTNTLAAYDAAPANFLRSIIVLDLATGGDTPSNQIMHWYWPITHNGAGTPPCLDASGYLILGVEKPTGYTGSVAAWGRVNLATRRFVDVMVVGTVFPNPGNRDENVGVSACSNGVVLLHGQESNAQVTGFWRQTDNTLHSFGGLSTARLENNCQGGAAAGAISGGRVFHVAHPHTLTCWSTT